MIVQGKVWGRTYALFNQNNVEVHYIEAAKGGYCSIHKHATKYNKFIVIKGKLSVSVWHGSMEDITILNAGEEITVPPGLLHKFYAQENTDALEIYWTELRAEDIERTTVGGFDAEIEV